MFRHTGKKRGFIHNMRLAVLLCLTAGFVNAYGFLAFMVLTTNVTGHAALLAVRLTEGDFQSLGIIVLWLLLFLSGAFFTGLHIARVGRNKTYAYTLPLALEILILLLVATFGHLYDRTNKATELFAGSLLFAMGLQNALVTMISGSVVRTTHLTGMFTDLGIDLASALAGHPPSRADINRRIILRVTIIFFFFLGGILGGYCFNFFHYKALVIPAVILIFAIFYDYFRVKILKARYHLRHRQVQDSL
ncbi:Uncharacterized membrane protein YoaK, UPF0700 family [Chitinophaga costaii]|uniref:Uncharacterized membrane protein YoaK, UPF0700 family n=1 Tax=Chitinophaga costaii TaxID=1335309 RepID=A0A1C4FF22_9BACT|nr:YoaK family protein [Chitinophaga costaii]PUZ20119.1 DUF1275 domain-containing protein [Chitinophaga costaii]SCC54588.1 Uncharacterized membrane protein YoaK, UPF0700 family [Chitinophaga costaii]